MLTYDYKTIHVQHFKETQHTTATTSCKSFQEYSMNGKEIVAMKASDFTM
jgi:hypothetical protein